MKNEEMISEMLLKSNFPAAKDIIMNIPFEKRNEVIIKVAYDLESIVVYAFICYLIGLEQNVFFHEIALEVLVNVFPYIEGAYNTAFYHAKAMYSHEPDNIDVKKQMLFFYDIPEKLLDEKDALEIANEIIAVDPNDSVAKRVISRIQNK